MDAEGLCTRKVHTNHSKIYLCFSPHKLMVYDTGASGCKKLQASSSTCRDLAECHPFLTSAGSQLRQCERWGVQMHSQPFWGYSTVPLPSPAIHTNPMYSHCNIKVHRPSLHLVRPCCRASTSCRCAAVASIIPQLLHGQAHRDDQFCWQMGACLEDRDASCALQEEP